MGKQRYPGPSQFEDKQEKIFFGRNAEKNRLYARVMTSSTLVLHAESGTGKSSLISAGLLPELKRTRPELLPVIKRFEGLKKDQGNLLKTEDDSPQAMIRELIDQIRPLIPQQQDAIPYLLKKEDDLWYWCKLLQMSGKSFLFIFDQFENTEYYKPRQVQEFKKELAKLFDTKIPDEFYNYMSENSPLSGGRSLSEISDEERHQFNSGFEFIKRSLDIKAVFIVQDDKLNVVSRMKDYFPGILQVTEELKLLNENGAEEAIRKPGSAEDDFDSPKINFDAVCGFLKKELADKKTGLYDPLVIQIVCTYIEGKIITDLAKAGILEDVKQSREITDLPKLKSIEALKLEGLTVNNEQGEVAIGEKYLPGFKSVVNTFYQDCWKKARPKDANDKKFEEQRKQILDELVIGGVRVPVLIDSFNKEKQAILTSLKETKLIRPMRISGESYYILCHNRFIKPIEADKKTIQVKEDEAKERANKTKTTNRWLAAGALVITAAIAAFIIYILDLKAKKYDQQRILNIMTTLGRSDNPTLSYIIGKDWHKDHLKSATVKNKLKKLESLVEVYLTGVYPSISDAEFAETDNKNQLLVMNGDERSTWDMNTHIMVKKEKITLRDSANEILRRNGKLYYVSRKGFNDKIMNEAGRIIASGDDFFDLGSFKISEDESYSIIDEIVVISDKPTGVIDIPRHGYTNPYTKNYEAYELNATAILDNRTFAAAYKNGVILIISLEDGGKLKITDTIRIESRNFMEDKSTGHLLYNKRLKRLFATNQGYNIDIVGISKSGTTKEKTVDEDGIDNTEPLKGHSATINCLAFSSDEKLLLSGSDDRTVILWDAEKMKKIATLKGPNASAIWYVGFSNKDSSIIAISEDNITYVWKRCQPLRLYERGQLYQFSPLDYYLLGLKNSKDTTTTITFFRSTLDYLLNIPATNEFPNDEDYDSSLSKAYAEVKILYNNLVRRKDYSSLIPGHNQLMLEKFYLDFLIREGELLNKGKSISEFTLDSLELLKTINTLKFYLTKDSSKPHIVYSVYRFNKIIDKYLKQSTRYADAAILLKMWNDRLISPSASRYGLTEGLKRIKSTMNLKWWKYYIYTNNYSEATNMLSVVNELSPMQSPIVSYTIATHLAFDQYEMALTLYKKSVKDGAKNTFQFFSLSQLKIVLKEFKTKNVAVNSIDKFCTEMKIGKLE